MHLFLPLWKSSVVCFVSVVAQRDGIVCAGYIAWKERSLLHLPSPSPLTLRFVHAALRSTGARWAWAEPPLRGPCRDHWCTTQTTHTYIRTHENALRTFGGLLNDHFDIAILKRSPRFLLSSLAWGAWNHQGSPLPKGFSADNAFPGNLEHPTSSRSTPSTFWGVGVLTAI